jgi:hypothetical protein
VLQLPLAHIVQQDDIDAGYIEDEVKLVIDVVNFNCNEFGKFDFSGLFDRLF